MIRLGVTGGIGSGKSTVASCLARCGARVIDADAIARAVTAPGGGAIEPIRQVFGADAINDQGALDRTAMRAKVFADSQARQQLESIIHPLVGRETEQAARAAQDAGCICLVFDVPLLVESGDRWRRRVDRVLVVDCTVDTQIQRVLSRSGLDEQEVRAIIDHQASRPQRLAAADLVLFNERLSLEALDAQVQTVWRHFGL
jgi:dephospho-CoA kinase